MEACECEPMSILKRNEWPFHQGFVSLGRRAVWPIATRPSTIVPVVLVVGMVVVGMVIVGVGVEVMELKLWHY